MATITSVGGVQYIGDAPAGETIHEHDTEINKDQIITSAVFAGPITFAAKAWGSCKINIKRSIFFI